MSHQWSIVVTVQNLELSDIISLSGIALVNQINLQCYIDPLSLSPELFKVSEYRYKLFASILGIGRGYLEVV